MIQQLVVVLHCFSWTFRAIFSTKIVGIFTIFEEHECFRVFVSWVIYNIRVHILQQYSRAAHVVNITNNHVAVTLDTTVYMWIIFGVVNKVNNFIIYEQNPLKEYDGEQCWPISVVNPW